LFSEFWAVKCITVTENTQRDYIKLPIGRFGEERYRNRLSKF
jgi:hypothetical protein